MNVFYNACMSEGRVVIFVVSVCDQSIASVVVDESSLVFVKPMGEAARCLPQNKIWGIDHKGFGTHKLQILK